MPFISRKLTATLRPLPILVPGYGLHGHRREEITNQPADEQADETQSCRTAKTISCGYFLRGDVVGCSANSTIGGEDRREPLRRLFLPL